MGPVLLSPIVVRGAKPENGSRSRLASLARSIPENERARKRGDRGHPRTRTTKIPPVWLRSHGRSTFSSRTKSREGGNGLAFGTTTMAASVVLCGWLLWGLSPLHIIPVVDRFAHSDAVAPQKRSPFALFFPRPFFLCLLFLFFSLLYLP